MSERGGPDSAGRRLVPVPDVIHAEPRGWEDIPPFILVRYVEGITFRELTRRGDTDAIAQAAYSAGKTLAPSAVRPFRSRDGWLRDRPSQRHCWKVRIPCRALLICVSRRRTCNGVCKRICVIAHMLWSGRGRHNLPIWTTRHTLSTAISANGTC